MKLIDKIWSEIINRGLMATGRGRIVLSKEGLEILLTDFGQEFEIENPDVDDLEEYYGKKLGIDETKTSQEFGILEETSTLSQTDS